MNKRNTALLLGFYAFLTVGCVSQKPLYYWGNYSKTLYHFRKEANDNTRNKHMAELESIVKNSIEKNLRVPPGVYCELGYMYAQQGKNKEALELLAQEKTIYPESTLLVDRLVEKIKASEDSGNDSQKSAKIGTNQSGS